MQALNTAAFQSTNSGAETLNRLQQQVYKATIEYFWSV